MDFEKSKRPPATVFWPVVAQRKYKRDLRVIKLAQELIEHVPRLDREEFRPAILAWARGSVLLEDSYSHLQQHGLVDEDGELKRSVTVVAHLISTQVKLLTQLLLTPASLTSIPKGDCPGDDIASFFARRAGSNAESE